MTADAADAGTAAAAPAADTPPPPRLAYDFVRLGLAAAVGVFIAGVVSLVLASEGIDGTQILVAAIFGFSAFSSIFYIVHTLLIFQRADGPTLTAWLKATQPDTRFGSLGAMLAGTGPTIAVQWSVAAIAAVLLFTIFPGLLREPITVILSVLVVAASWGVTVVAYAVHYARVDAAFGGFQFPDDAPRVFKDYVYLSVQIQTTFSTSDVSLMTTRARSIVTGHTLVSFAFNTVIIAMLITVLFLGH